MKIQVVANAATREIICISVAEGKRHDLKLLKDSRLPVLDGTEVLLDKGYVGYAKIHANSTMPKKASKKHPLTKEERAWNMDVSKRRIYIEHINRYIKRFRILSSRYRNKRKRFGLRASLICGIYNAQH